MIGKVKTKSVEGTGCLIGKNIVLTVAHILFYMIGDVMAHRVQYVPAGEANK